MIKLRANIFDHSGYKDWDRVIKQVNQTFALANLKLEVNVIKRDFDIKWGKWDGKKHRVDYSWFAETFSKPSEGKDFAIAVYSYEQSNSGGKNSLNGQSIEKNYGVSEVWLRYKKGRTDYIGDGIRVDQLVKLIIHECGHGIADHLLGDSKQYDKVHYYEDDKDNLRDFYRYIKGYTIDMTTRNMSYLEPTLRAYLQKALDKWNATHDIKVGVSTTFRDAVDQEAAFKAGTSKARFGQSLHNFTPAYAADIYFYVGGKAVWNRPELFKEFRALVPLLEHGGEWKGFVDMPHFQLKMTYQDAQAGRVKPIIETPQPDMKDIVKSIIIKMSLPQFKETVTKLLKLI